MKKVIAILILSGSIASCSSSKIVSRSSEPQQTTTKEVVVTSYGPKGKIIRSVVTKEVPFKEVTVLDITERKKRAKSKENLKESKEASTKDVEFYAYLDEIKNDKTPSSIKAGLSSNNDYESWMNVIKEKSFVYKNLSKLQENSAPKDGEGDKGKNWASIAGFSVSIVGLIIFGFIFGTVAIVFGAIGLKSDMRGLAIAALVIGIVDVIAAIIIAAAAA